MVSSQGPGPVSFLPYLEGVGGSVVSSMGEGVRGEEGADTSSL